VSASFECSASAIIVLLEDCSKVALYVSKYRPKNPIICVTRNQKIARQLLICRGCLPLVYTYSKLKLYQDDVNKRIKWAIEKGKEMCLLNNQDLVITLQVWKPQTNHITNAIKMFRVDEKTDNKLFLDDLADISTTPNSSFLREENKSC